MLLASAPLEGIDLRLNRVAQQRASFHFPRRIRERLSNTTNQSRVLFAYMDFDTNDAASPKAPTISSNVFSLCIRQCRCPVVS